MANALLERETLSRADFESVMQGKELPPMTAAEKMEPSQDAQADPTPDKAQDGAETAAFQMDGEQTDEAFIDPDKDSL